jgi:endonuclease-3
MALSKAEKVDKIGRLLDDLYPKQPIPLDHNSAYTLLVAVMLSAQTTDKKVNQVTPFLFKKASTPAQMAELDVAEIQQIIREIGLAPTKAKNLAKMATQLLNDFQGEIPDNFEGLERLAGVGHKTASVVMAQWFGVDAFPVDTHIHRLAARWGLSNGQNVARTERDLKRCFDVSEWRRRHLQIIFFGREYCPARHHDMTNCPICSFAASKARVKAESKR